MFVFGRGRSTKGNHRGSPPPPQEQKSKVSLSVFNRHVALICSRDGEDTTFLRPWLLVTEDTLDSLTP